MNDDAAKCHLPCVCPSVILMTMTSSSVCLCDILLLSMLELCIDSHFVSGASCCMHLNSLPCSQLPFADTLSADLHFGHAGALKSLFVLFCKAAALGQRVFGVSCQASCVFGHTECHINSGQRIDMEVSYSCGLMSLPWHAHIVFT